MMTVNGTMMTPIMMIWMMKRNLKKIWKHPQKKEKRRKKEKVIYIAKNRSSFPGTLAEQSLTYQTKRVLGPDPFGKLD